MLKEGKIEERAISVEEKLTKVKDGVEVEIATETPFGLLAEKIGYKKFKNIEPLFIRENGKEEFAIHFSEEINLKTSDGQTIDLLDPDIIQKRKGLSVYFIRSDLNSISEGFQQIPILREGSQELLGHLIRYKKFEQLGDVLAFWHEIGHLFTASKTKRKITELDTKIYSAYLKGGLVPKEDEVLYSYDEDENFRTPHAIPRELLMEYKLHQAADERSAWAFAIRALRKFRGKGLDPEPELRTLQDLKEFLSAPENLGGYQEELDEILETDDTPSLFVK